MTHAKGHLRDEFYEIVDNIHSNDAWLNSKKNREHTRQYVGLMWNCTDIIPNLISDDLADIASIYLKDYDRGKKIGNCAQIARLLRDTLEQIEK